MIIKNIFTKIYINPFFYIFIILFLMMGKIYNLLIFMLLIFIHETGHFITAILLKWNVDKICIYPYGGISKFNELINVPLIEEFFVLVMGPITQIFFFLIFKNIISTKYIDTLILYNNFILIFNLLPIYPLDGGKIINIIFSLFFSYKTSFKITYIISFISIGVILSISIITKSLFYILVTISIFSKINSELDLLKYYFNKFIMERYLYDFKFNKINMVNSIDKFKRDNIHFIKYNKELISEKDYLKTIWI